MTTHYLSEIRLHQAATIRTVFGEHALKQRLLAMGLVPGVSVEVVKIAPLGDPIDIKVKGYHLSLRRSEAQQVCVDLLATK